MRKEKYNIQGMSCSSCKAHVEKAVNNLNGIKKVNVNLISNNMIVEYDENIVNSQKIIDSVISAGYGATLENEDNNRNIEKITNSNILEIMKKRLKVSVFFWIPLMYIAMHHMFYEWLGLPVPQIVKNLFHGTENALTFGFTQFLLLLPIVYMNRNYFIVGFKRLWKKSPNMDSLIAIGSTASILYGIYAFYMIGYCLGHNQITLVEKFMNDLYFESAGTILTLVTIRKVFRNKVKR